MILVITNTRRETMTFVEYNSKENQAKIAQRMFEYMKKNAISPNKIKKDIGIAELTIVKILKGKPVAFDVLCRVELYLDGIEKEKGSDRE